MDGQQRMQMYRNKAEFIKGLQKLLIEHNGCQTVSNLQRLEYVRVGSNEYMYVILDNNCQKRIDISCSSHEAILSSYTRLMGYWNEFTYINSDEEKRYEKIISTATFYSFGSKCHINN